MEPLYPLMFQPRFKERVWGGRRLAALYGKRLPPDVPIGESWEISDRPGDESVVANGPLAGRTIHSLMVERGPEILGTAAAAQGQRFPLLCKILDARERLSLQVHPPPRAAHLGDPKTEMWYIAAADPGAELFVGLRAGVTPAAFERGITSGRVADCFHRVPVRAGDAMFLPSGRVHAIGAGLVIFEIQQNSDTTFRVYDWDRLGLDGRPRDLHVAESLESIDFEDFEPPLISASGHRRGEFVTRTLVDDPLFRAELIDAEAPAEWRPTSGMHVLVSIAGSVEIHTTGARTAMRPGDFSLIPASLADASLKAEAGSRFLIVDGRHTAH